MKQYPSIQKALNRLKAQTHQAQSINKDTYLGHMTIWNENNDGVERQLFVWYNNGSTIRIKVQNRTVEAIQQALKEIEISILLES